MLLELKNLSAGYDGNTVLRDISLHVKDGEIVALIGPNGAGKSTVLKAIFGLADVTAGAVRFNGAPVTKRATHELLAHGIGFVPQGRLVFGRLTVEENLRMGGWLMADPRAVAVRLKEIYTEHPVLRQRRHEPARNLSGGNQQLVAIARALMNRPRLLLLDEPSLGLAPQVTADIYRTLKTCHRAGLSMLIVEQNVSVALRVCDRGYVLVNGTVRYAGMPNTLLNPERLREMFLG